MGEVDGLSRDIEKKSGEGNAKVLHEDGERNASTLSLPGEAHCMVSTNGKAGSPEMMPPLAEPVHGVVLSGMEPPTQGRMSIPWVGEDHSDCVKSIMLFDVVYGNSECSGSSVDRGLLVPWSIW